ncbi:hypothetical protein ACOSP7_022364 [Xanthoceras sorbifolium]
MYLVSLFFLPLLCIYSRLFADSTDSNPFLFEEEKMTLDALTALVLQDLRKLTAYKRVTEELLMEFKLAPDSSGASQCLGEHGTVTVDQRASNSEGGKFKLVLRWNFNNKKIIFSIVVELFHTTSRRRCEYAQYGCQAVFFLPSTEQLSPSVMECVLANHSDLDSEMLQGDLASCDICHGCFLSSF